MNSMYHVGGILNITWSIAVEEQFYLFWAPMVKRFYRRLPYLITGITVFSLTVGMLNAANAFHLSEAWQVFIRSLQFHYMGIGALFAWLLYSRKDALLQSPFFISKGWRVLLTSLLPAYFFFYEKSLIGEVLLPLPLGLLYGWLIVNVGANPNRIFSLEHPVLHYLGKISYGIYMYHMVVVYGMAFIFGKFTGLHHLWDNHSGCRYILSLVRGTIAEILQTKSIITPGRQAGDRSKSKRPAFQRALVFVSK